MKIHEYQAKELLKDAGVPIQDGVVITDISELEDALNSVEKEFNAKQFVVKAQIHAGGRGKGGGVKFCTSRDGVKEHVENKRN